MAEVRWIGGAAATFDVWTVTPGGTVGSETFTISVGNKTISVTADSGDAVANVVDKLLAAWEGAAELYPEFAELTPTDSSTHLTLTGTVAGRQHIITADASGSATLTAANTETATGPNDWGNAANFSGGTLPTTGDNVYIDNTVYSILYGLEENEDTFDSLHIGANVSPGFTIGLPENNASGYPEYRPTYLYVEASSVRVGAGEGQGSQRIKLNFGSTQTDCMVIRTGTGAEPGVPACLIKGSNSDNVLSVYQNANVGVAFFGGETAEFDAIRSAGQVWLGPGCTLDTVQVTSGVLRRNSDCTTHEQTGGESIIEGDADTTTLTVKGGVCRYNSDGTAGTVNVGGGAVTATIDCSADSRPRTFTDTNMLDNSVIRDPSRSIVYTNGIALSTSAREVSAV